MNTTNETVETVVTEGNVPSSPTGGKKNNSNLIWVVLVVVLVVLGALVAYQKGMFGGATTPVDEPVGTIDPTTVVATVNGVDITRGELDEKANQIRVTLPEGATDPSVNPGFEAQVLDEIISLQLLLARADERGLSVTNETVEGEIAALVELFGSQEAFDLQLQAANLTLDDLRKNMNNELKIRALVDADTNVEEVTVTDEELKAAYDLAFPAGGEDTPTLEQVGEMLRAQLIRQKSEAIVNAYISEIRSTASIENFL